MKITIGRRPKRKMMLFYVGQCLFLSMILFGLLKPAFKSNVFFHLSTYLIVTVLMILMMQIHYLASQKYWSLEDDTIHFVMPKFRLSLIKEIIPAYQTHTLKPTLSVPLSQIDGIAVDVRFYTYMGYQLQEPHLHLIFCLKDGTSISMFAGDGHYQEEMKQMITELKKKSITLIDPYHLLDGDIQDLYLKVGKFKCQI